MLEFWKDAVLKTKLHLLFLEDWRSLTCLIVSYLGTLVLTLAICTSWQTCTQKSLECWHKPGTGTSGPSPWEQECLSIPPWPCSPEGGSFGYVRPVPETDKSSPEASPSLSQFVYSVNFFTWQLVDPDPTRSPWVSHDCITEINGPTYFSLPKYSREIYQF